MLDLRDPRPPREPSPPPLAFDGQAVLACDAGGTVSITSDRQSPPGSVIG